MVTKKEKIFLDNKAIVEQAIEEGKSEEEIAFEYNIKVEEVERYLKAPKRDIHAYFKRRGEREERHGLTSCGICIARAANFLKNKGGTFEEMEEQVKRKHPEIKNVRRYVQRFIRYVTGQGKYDDWIVENEKRMWKTRSPELWEDESEEFRKGYEEAGLTTPEDLFEKYAERGRKIDKEIQRFNAGEVTDEEMEHFGVMKEALAASLGEEEEDFF